MRSKLFTIFIVIVVIMTVSYNIYETKSTTGMSSLLLENVEALADSGEGGAGCSASLPCSNGATVTCHGFRCVVHSIYVECADKDGNIARSTC